MKGMAFSNSACILKPNLCYALIFLEEGATLGIEFFSPNVLIFSLCLYSTRYFYFYVNLLVAKELASISKNWSWATLIYASKIIDFTSFSTYW